MGEVTIKIIPFPSYIDRHGGFRVACFMGGMIHMNLDDITSFTVGGIPVLGVRHSPNSDYVLIIDPPPLPGPGVYEIRCAWRTTGVPFVGTITYVDEPRTKLFWQGYGHASNYSWLGDFGAAPPEGELAWGPPTNERQNYGAGNTLTHIPPNLRSGCTWVSTGTGPRKVAYGRWYTPEFCGVRRIPAGIWTIKHAAQHYGSWYHRGNMDQFSLYVWRTDPPGVVGYVYDNTDGLLNPAGVLGTDQFHLQHVVYDVQGWEVNGIEDGDVLCLEIWGAAGMIQNALWSAIGSHYGGVNEPMVNGLIEHISDPEPPSIRACIIGPPIFGESQPQVPLPVANSIRYRGGTFFSPCDDSSVITADPEAHWEVKTEGAGDQVDFNGNHWTVVRPEPVVVQRPRISVRPPPRLTDPVQQINALADPGGVIETAENYLRSLDGE